MFERCSSFHEAAFCLVELKKYESFITLCRSANFLKEDYANILYSAPTAELAMHLVTFPCMSTSILTLFEAMHLLTVALSVAEGVKLLEMCSKQMKISIMKVVLQDERTSWDILESLIHHFQSEGFDDLAVDVYAALVVKITINQVVDSIKQEQVLVGPDQSHALLRHMVPSACSSNSDNQNGSEEEATYQGSIDDQSSEEECTVHIQSTPL